MISLKNNELLRFHVCVGAQVTFTLTKNAEDMEVLRVFHLAVQLATTEICPCLQGCFEPLSGNIQPVDGRVRAFLMQRDADVWVGDHAWDDGFLTFGYHAVVTPHKPHLRV